MPTTRVFKSGNSVAVRLPKALGVREGTEVRVREERGRYIIEPVSRGPDDRIDLTGIAGSIPRLKPIPDEEREFDQSPRPWHLLERGER
jgi:antitoxin VapB